MDATYQTCELVSLNDQLGRFSFPKNFCCGTPLFDSYVNKGGLKRALQSENIHATGLVIDGRLMGYVTLTLSVLDRPRVWPLLKQQSNQPPQLPVLKLLMIAVDQHFQKRGFGLLLVSESFQRAIGVHATVPIKGIYLDTGPGTEAFYASYGFQALEASSQQATTPMFIAMAEVLDAMDEALRVDRG